MKTVYFVRHAKSSWDFPGLSDFDRPLNKRGLRDAPFMATMLKQKGVKIDRIITSPANRAKTTAGFFARALEVSDLSHDKTIYEAYTHEVISIVKSQTETVNTIMVFGHNPTFTSIANMFSENYISNIPTCGIIKVEAEIESWENFDEQNGSMSNFYYPKQFFK